MHSRLFYNCTHRVLKFKAVYFIPQTQLFHHILHFFSGFIRDPNGQSKASLNCSKFLNAPFTLILFSVVLSLRRIFSVSPGVSLMHCCKAEVIQKICACVKFSPGIFGSRSLLLDHEAYASYANFAPATSAISSI